LALKHQKNIGNRNIKVLIQIRCVKRRELIKVVLMLIVLSISYLLNSEIHAQQGLGTYIVKYKIKISNLGDLNYPLTQMKNMTIIAVDDYQRFRDLNIYINGRNAAIKNEKVDEYKNIVVEILDLPNELPPKQEITIEIEVSVDLYARNPPNISLEDSGKISEIPETLREKYCQLTGLWNKSLIAQNIARRLAENKTNTLEVLVTLIKWIEENIQIPLSSGARMPQYPDETINLKVGDCDDQSNLLVAMCRSLGIPAYIQMGFIYLEGRTYEDTMFNGRYKLTAKNAGGHAWARVYIPPWGWLSIDMTYYIPYNIKEGRYMISINPLDHITSGALYIAKTIITENYIHGDYIMELNEWIEELDKYNLKWEEEYSISPKMVESQNPLLTDPIALTSIILLVGLIITTLTIYVKVLKKRGRGIMNIKAPTYR